MRPKGQSIPGSFFEAASNTLGGFLIAWMAWVHVVGPFLNYDVHYLDGFLVTFFFAILSLVRGFVIRRIFNSWTWRGHETE